MNEMLNFRTNLIIICSIPIFVILVIIGFMKIRVQYLKKEIKKLTLKERKDALRSASEEIFKMVDLDNSGQLDESEFFQY